MANTPLYNFGYFRDISKSLENLKNLAIPESWDFGEGNSNKILLNYISHTFTKIEHEKKISFDDGNNYACFNTGLVTEHYENIFGLFMRNKKPLSKIPYFFIGWKKQSDQDLLKFSVLPETANYFVDPSHLLYDPNLELRVDLDHILNDNIDRFPEELKAKGTYEVRNSLYGAIELIKKKVKINYKTAIPQYFGGTIQLLLPLSFSDKRRADLALVVRKNGNFYSGRTCLTLEMAYNNARLIARPDQDWLQG
jgi:hypothetical protein